MANENPVALYWSNVHNRARQEMQRVRFGSEMEAASGGSSATFRMSDSPDYVSEILSSSPVDFIKRYPNEVNAMREEIGLNPMDSNDAAPVYQEANWLTDTLEKAVGTPQIKKWLESKAINIGVFSLAIVLVLGGLVILALSNDTVKAVAKDAVKTAAV